MEEYLEEIADALAGKYVVTETSDGKALEITPVSGTAKSKNITHENGKFSYDGKTFNSVDELISSFGKIEESVVNDTFKKNGIEVAAGNKGTISNSGLHEEIENVTLDDIADKASELGYEVMDDEEDDQTILVYKTESNEEDDFDDFDNTELYNYLDSIPAVRYQTDNRDQSCLAIWLKDLDENKEIKSEDFVPDDLPVIGINSTCFFAKLHKDELQDTDDLWDMIDRLAGMSIEEIYNEAGGEEAGFTMEDAEAIYDYIGTVSDDDFSTIWEVVVNGNDSLLQDSAELVDENKETLKEDVGMEDVLELLIPNESDIQPEEAPEVVEVEVETPEVQPSNEALADLAKYLISAEASIKSLHHNLIGGDWFENHNKLGDYAYYIGNVQDDIIEQLLMVGGVEPSIAEAIQKYPTLEIQPRNKQESFAQLKVIFDTIIPMIDTAKPILPADVVSKLEEYQNYLRKESDYKIVRNLQEQYILVSNKDIKKRLVTEAKIDEVKKDAEEECLKRGCDTYVYQLGEDIFFAEEKPTDTRLINKGILTLGKYRFGISEGKPVANWFEESKSKSSNKKSLKELAESLQDDKTFEDPYDSESEKEIVGKASYDKKNANQEIGRDPKDIPHEEFKGGKNPEENNKAANFNKKNANSEISNTITGKVVNDSFEGTATQEIISKATYNHNELNVKGTPQGKNVEVVESKEVEVEEDKDEVSLAAYKKSHKDEIDLCYKNTYGEDIDKDLYDSLAEYMYNTSITGNINNKKDYKSMNDKIKEAEINGDKINIIDNALDGHEDNQPK